MTFRNPEFHDANRAGDEVESSRHLTGKGETPMPIDPNIHDHIEAMDRLDAGERLAPVFSPPPVPGQRVGADLERIDHEVANQVAGELLTAKEAVMRAAKLLPLAGQIDLHLHFNVIQNEADQATAKLADRWES